MQDAEATEDIREEKECCSNNDSFICCDTLIVRADFNLELIVWSLLVNYISSRHKIKEFPLWPNSTRIHNTTVITVYITTITVSKSQKSRSFADKLRERYGRIGSDMRRLSKRAYRPVVKYPYGLVIEILSTFLSSFNKADLVVIIDIDTTV